MGAAVRRFAILAVCTANICRSPLMEKLLRHRLEAEHFEVASAGIQGWELAPMDGMAALELARLGLSSAGFRSHPIDSRMVDSADLVLTATREQRSAVLALNPLALRRTFTLLEFAALAPLCRADSLTALVKEAARLRSQGPAVIDIDDPYRGGPEVHRRVADQIDVAVAVVSGTLNDNFDGVGAAADR